MLNYTISGNYRTNKTATLFIINNDISLNYCLFRDDYLWGGGMDESIRKLKTTTFFGRRLTRWQLQEVSQTVEMFLSLNRKELSQTICEHLNWRIDLAPTPKASCRQMHEALESKRIWELPAKGPGYARARRPLEWTSHTES